MVCKVGRRAQDRLAARCFGKCRGTWLRVDIGKKMIQTETRLTLPTTPARSPSVHPRRGSKRRYARMTSPGQPSKGIADGRVKKGEDL